ncbi:OmpA family protein [Alteromonas sp. ASW11-36]|uniref:OmpA family protein n=1 Tax=Alteromonas arenosi TaxID=3055817 RepID=A0ABT7T0E7_9ALTE|nr:OmpA family protein [Alteromonas sp. ASW11-36]MDM7861908.1 OmpA family protein [Alteromonas sp. ASW11-36]
MFYHTANKTNAEIDDSGAWLSIGDLMSALLMIFALLLISALVQISEVAEQSQNNRIMIIKGINDALKAADISVEADSETGDISILDSVLFEQNDYLLKESGKEFLDRFIPIYSSVVFQSSETSHEVVRIVLEGHSSIEGAFDHNMRLSVLRANSVSQYVNQMTFPDKEQFFGKLLVSGRGSLDADKLRVNESDRKVMFRFQFRGQEFKKIIGQRELLNVDE